MGSANCKTLLHSSSLLAHPYGFRLHRRCGSILAFLKINRAETGAYEQNANVTRQPLRRILSHTAGLPFQGLPGYASGDPIPTVLQILNGERPANTGPIRVDVVPGTVWRYSNEGYAVLQTLMSDVTGKAFPEIMKELVLRPAGMTQSTYEQPLPKNLWSLAATPYDDNGEPVKGGWHTIAVLRGNSSTTSA
jgi:CubicO group peptidase (beta-lactamase class C family)